ncbi:anti-sigma factor [uncultured Psychroserpens sp.]|uniref:anti-sigma factor n=1 Tax=uncultured Psychroserpens sp. TaxID=255436 RepID=UPI00261C1485|nr:anti-sigma factor [uncultured Psychroserpens sp.]
MMDKTYILNNGILELYVLGELNRHEQQQVEDALEQYSELKTELDHIEKSFETLALQNGMHVPSSVKSALLENLSSVSPKTVPLQASTKSLNKYYIGIAASVAALLLIGLFYIYSELNTTKEQLQLAEEENIKLSDEIKNLNNDFNEIANWYITINNPNTQKYIMTGNALRPEATVVSYVNNIDKSVIINTKQLPELDDAHDYQMWADVKGEMINMGLIDTSKEMLAMTYIDDAESLNITIEPSGGNDHPTVSQLITNVYLR